MSLINAIRNAFLEKDKRGWDTIYFAIDVHGTIVVPNYKANDIPKTFYPLAKETLQVLTNRSDVTLILYTCSHPHEIKDYLEDFKENNIIVDYGNSNPEVRTDLEGYGNYDEKFYFNVLLDDKAGFNARTDWKEIYLFLTRPEPYSVTGVALGLVEKSLNDIKRLRDSLTVTLATSTLEEWIKSCKTSGDEFREAKMEVSALTSDAMGQAYSNALKLLTELEPSQDTSNEFGMVDWRETQ